MTKKTETQNVPQQTEAPQHGENADLEAQLYAWGVSGEPITWAPTRFQASLVAIRTYDLGFGALSTVQGMLDASFPGNTLDAGACVVNKPAPEPIVEHFRSDGLSKLTTGSVVKLPADHFTWYVDGQIVGHGETVEGLELTPGDRVVEVQIALAGVIYNKRKVVTIS